jgi:glycosyltransferase involved in cell wall biosynthesis
MYSPKISIIIPAYNASNYLAEAIDSALAQTYNNVEIIVVNDGSKDDGATREIALSYGDKIRYFEKENGGSSSALNTGIANMTGEWFSWLSHDDLYVPQKLERQIAYIESLKLDERDVCNHVFFSASELIDANGALIRSCNGDKERSFSEKISAFPHNGYLIAEPTVYCFHGCSCLVHKKVFESIGAFDEKLRLINDLDMWFRVYAAGYKIHYIPDALVKGRIHSKQVSKSIGYSYHNPEQDMFWSRSFDWLTENYPEQYELFYLFGCNAYAKTRNADGDRAFDHVLALKPEMKHSLGAKRIWLCGYARVRNFLKHVYLKLKK